MQSERSAYVPICLFPLQFEGTVKIPVGRVQVVVKCEFLARFYLHPCFFVVLSLFYFFPRFANIRYPTFPHSLSFQKR